MYLKMEGTGGLHSDQTGYWSVVSYLEMQKLMRHCVWTGCFAKMIQSMGEQVSSWCPFAGQLGWEKTARKILMWFYWPTLFLDVIQYCQTCEECQWHGGWRMKAPLTPLPVIGAPFRKSKLHCRSISHNRTRKLFDSGNEWLCDPIPRGSAITNYFCQ